MMILDFRRIRILDLISSARFCAGRVALWAVLLSLSGIWTAAAAPKPDLWARWERHDPSAAARIDYDGWTAFLDKYLVSDHPSGVNRVRYGSVSPEDRLNLGGFLNRLQQVIVTGLNRQEQRAFWINLYNALAVKIVLDHYPVKSIQDIDISGFLKNGPWKAKLLKIEGEEVSLDDIEHRILRPIWKDNRIHYAVNCASIGCPNLQPVPFTSENTDRLLEKGAREYINHPRGARFEGNGRLVVSSIYDWFQEDFEGSRQGVIRHLIRYAEAPLANRLKTFSGDAAYEYDWSLNSP